MENERILPQHIGIILDGNGRWAKKRGMPRSYGHYVGSDNLEKMCNIICGMGIRYLTVYAFSTENWKRSQEEVGTLMNLFRRYLKRCLKSAHKNKMRVTIIGDPTALDEDIQETIRVLEEETAAYTGMHLQIALNYGARDEILRAVEKVSADVKAGKIPGDKLSEEEFASYLDTSLVPDPDLIIRTSGEQRISNFLLWQIAYSEFYFTETPWPAFDTEELNKALDYYSTRNRRFGDAK